VNNLKGGSAVQFSSIESKNRFGLRGVEDLGDGISAIFLLENSFSTGTGALGKTDTLFDAAAYVGVTGKFGQLTLGRQLNVAEDLIVDLDPSRVIGSTAAITPDALTGTNFFVGDTRFNNMVKYKTRIGGAGLGASYSFGGVAGNTRAGSNYAVSLTYQTGPLYGGASYQRTYSPDASQFAQTLHVVFPVDGERRRGRQQFATPGQRAAGRGHVAGDARARADGCVLRRYRKQSR
jgi:predicted porin